MINSSSNYSTENKSFINKDEDLENEVLLHKYNLFQQFFVVGLEPKILHLIGKVDLKAFPEHIIGPKIITKYPNMNLPYINISDSLIESHCFPKGFVNLITECKQSELKEKLLQTKDFIFSLDNCQINQNVTLNTNRIYYFCYMFYEKLDDYQTCLNLKKKFINKSNINNSFSVKRYFLVPKVICISSFSPYIYQSKLILHFLKQNVDKSSYSKYLENNSDISPSDNNIPIDKMIEGLIYNLPGLPRANFILKINKNNFISEEDYIHSIININENDNDIIFYSSPCNRKPKPIINYSKLMRFFKIEEIFEIIKCILLEEPILFFCSDIEDLTYTIQGIISLIYPFEYPYPLVEVLPEQNYTFINIYKSFIFGINQIYSEDFFVLKGINLDEQRNIKIILIENRFNNLINSKEKEKNKVILPIKPNNTRFLKITQKTIDDTISDIRDFYIKTKNMIGENREEKIEDKIDDKKIDEKKIKLPLHYYTKCCKKLDINLETKFKDIKSKIKEKENDKEKYIVSQKIEKEKENIFNEEIVENFLYFFTSIILHYQQFCTKFSYSYIDDNDPKTTTSKTGYYYREKELEKKYYENNLTIDDLFNCELFLDDVPNLDRPFYSKFLHTKIFFNFMKKKFFPMSVQDKLDILFFDEKVNEKLSRESGTKKIETKFLDYDISNISGNLDVGCLCKPFSDNFKQFLLQEKNKNKLLDYFQYLVIENIDNIIDNSKSKNTTYSMDNYYSSNTKDIDMNLKIYYFVFPKLLIDNIFYKENKNEEESKNTWNTTNFTYKNSNCLYNQYEKEVNAIINDENIIKNYYNYYYTINPIKSYKRPIDYFIKILYFQYFAKTFHLIPFSKRNYYFSYLINFMINNKDILDEKSILMMFKTIIYHGDKNMAKDFYQFIPNKTYSSFLMLREKTRPDKNFIGYDSSSTKKIINNEGDNENDSEQMSKSSKSRSNSGFNSSNIRLSAMSNLNNIRKSSPFMDKEEMTNSNIYFVMEGKSNIYKKDDTFNFSINFFCNHKKDDNNNICNHPVESNLEKCFDEDKLYIEFKCKKCQKTQEFEIACRYKDVKKENKNNNEQEIIIKTKLYSPVTLLENDWFKDTQQLNLNNLTEKYLDSFICALFYFYNQGLLCDFLAPKIITKKNLEIENNINYNIKSKEKITKEKNNINNYYSNYNIKLIDEMEENKVNTFIYNTNDNNNINEMKSNSINIISSNVINNSKNYRDSVEIKSKVQNDDINLRRGSVFDISDQKLNFFEFKADNKKPSSLVSRSNKKQKSSNSKKKTVGFTKQGKKVAHKKNNLSYSTFLNNK